MPAATIDPIPIAARFVTDTQVVISREKDPAAFGVLTIGAINAGSAPKIIPDSAEVKVNLRSQSPEGRKLLQDGTARVGKSAAAMGGAPEPTTSYVGGTGVMTKDETMAKAAVAVMRPALGKRLAF